MDTTTRTIAKSVTWQLIGLLSMTVVGYVFTQSFAASGGIAITSAISGLIAYVLHEKLWSRVAWGRRDRTVHADFAG